MRHRPLASIGIAVSMTLFAGCWTYRVQADGIGGTTDPMPVLVKGDTLSKKSITTWSFLWGVFESPDEISLACGDRGLKEAVVTSNVGYTVLTLITAGLVSPRRVTARCATPDPEEGTLGAPRGVP